MSKSKIADSRCFTLQDGFKSEDKIWSYQIPGLPPDSVTNAQTRIKSVSLVSDQSKQIMTLRLEKHLPNRAIDSQSLHKYMSISFEKFRLQYTAEYTSSEGSNNKVRPASARELTDYIERLLRAGIRLNGIGYYWYGHSNSQLKSTTCFMLAGTPKNAAQQLESLADFPKNQWPKARTALDYSFQQPDSQQISDPIGARTSRMFAQKTTFLLMAAA
ncbi:MAG: hypothetical protein Q9198_004832 [Flavoplaca austrocitrina]